VHEVGLGSAQAAVQLGQPLLADEDDGHLGPGLFAPQKVCEILAGRDIVGITKDAGGAEQVFERIGQPPARPSPLRR
jgi:hypothetical protein